MAEVVTKLSALLQAEREALLSGDFDRVAALMSEKQALADSLAGEVGSVSVLHPLRDELERNGQLFDRALEGVRAVVARIGNLEAVRKTLHTYNAQGRREEIAQPGTTTLERRA